MRFSLHLVTRGDFLLRQLTPGTLADDSVDLADRAKTHKVRQKSTMESVVMVV